MKNHSKDPRYKEYLALQRRESELWEAKHKNRIKLDEPYHHGYDHYLVPRFDIQNREDADIFWDIAESLSQVKWTRKKKASKSERKKGDKYVNDLYTPYIKSIYSNAYDRLPASYKKWFMPKKEGWNYDPSGRWVEYDSCGSLYFREDGGVKKSWGIIHDEGYRCVVPYFYFVTKTKKHMVEYGNIIDEVVEQELAEIRDRLDSLEFRHISKWCSNAPKDFRREINKGKAAHNKRTLRNLLALDHPDDATRNYEEFIVYRKDAGWLWW